MKRIRVAIDTEKCVSSGNCADIAPHTFSQEDDTGVVILLEAEPDDVQIEVVKKAARLCPAQAISVMEEDE